MSEEMGGLKNNDDILKLLQDLVRAELGEMKLQLETMQGEIKALQKELKAVKEARSIDKASIANDLKIKDTKDDNPKAEAVENEEMTKTQIALEKAKELLNEKKTLLALQAKEKKREQDAKREAAQERARKKREEKKAKEELERVRQELAELELYEKYGIKRKGNILEFGMYPQTSEVPEPIEWVILEEDEGKALLISKYALECCPYNNQYEDTNWEKCSLRHFLNNDFYEQVFSLDERKNVIKTLVNADKNIKYDTEPGSDVEDRVFLLSAQEVEKYSKLKSKEVRKCCPTRYAIKRGVYANNDCSWWWLRTPGNHSYNTSSVCYDGSISYDGLVVTNSGSAVRPALWIDIKL